MKEILDIVMLVAFAMFILFLIRGVAAQTMKKDEIRKKLKKERDERVID
ncbi:hypothetical protein LMG7974_00555 [Campylobacter majalis]|uniref:Small hydrophobic protein n=1 Tax=Campylobacter majalis TaxID=2790656 RepID=A0ABM8Q4G7_9BACT|nr:hypothetical protein [Campylobacter majalis]CAD7287675.1 hypothetical protein LMG7974_00555 [Campylobacter majalis]